MKHTAWFTPLTTLISMSLPAVGIMTTDFPGAWIATSRCAFP
jgi:hypothetical protein